MSVEQQVKKFGNSKDYGKSIEILPKTYKDTILLACGDSLETEYKMFTMEGTKSARLRSSGWNTRGKAHEIVGIRIKPSIDFTASDPADQIAIMNFFYENSRLVIRKDTKDLSDEAIVKYLDHSVLPDDGYQAIANATSTGLVNLKGGSANISPNLLGFRGLDDPIGINESTQLDIILKFDSNLPATAVYSATAGQPFMPGEGLTSDKGYFIVLELVTKEIRVS